MTIVTKIPDCFQYIGKVCFTNIQAITQYPRPDFSYYVPLNEQIFADISGNI